MRRWTDRLRTKTQVPGPAVVVGLAAEARVARRLGWPVAIGGGTPAGAATAAERLVEQGAQGLVSFGFAGGLIPGLRPGDVIVPRSVLVGEQALHADTALADRLGGMTDHVLIAGNAVVARAEDKGRLHETTGAHAVDLETGAVASVASRSGLPFAALRAICDAAERDLPPAALVALDGRGMIGLARVVGSVMAHPGQVPGLIGLALDAAVARRALLDRLERLRVDGPPLK